MSGKPLACGVTPRSRRLATLRGEAPKRRAEPASASRRPRAISSAVVFPAPLGPSIATISPRPTANESESSARMGPYDLATFSKESIIANESSSGRLEQRLELRDVRCERVAAAFGQAIACKGAAVDERLLFLDVSGVDELREVSAEVAVADVERARQL